MLLRTISELLGCLFCTLGPPLAHSPAGTGLCAMVLQSLANKPQNYQQVVLNRKNNALQKSQTEKKEPLSCRKEANRNSVIYF